MDITELKRLFASKVYGKGWALYCRAHGWDLLMTRDDWQIGVMAAADYDLATVETIMEQGFPSYSTGPTFRALLLPDEVRYKAAVLCAPLHIWSFSERELGHHLLRWPEVDDPSKSRLEKYLWHPSKLHDVTTFVELTLAPEQKLTAWQCGALQLLARAEVCGGLSAEEAASVPGFAKAAVAEGWLTPTPLGNFLKADLRKPGSPAVKHAAEFEHYLQRVVK